MKQDQVFVMHAKEHSGMTMPIETGSYFKKAISHRTAYRHSQWPPKLEGFYVCAYGNTVSLVHAQQPLANRFSTHLRAVKRYGNCFAVTSLMHGKYLFWYI
jgi:hypothetical protein